MLDRGSNSAIHMEGTLDGIRKERILGLLEVLEPLGGRALVRGTSALLVVGDERAGDRGHDVDEELEEERGGQRAAELDHAAWRALLEGKVLLEHLQRGLQGLVRQRLALEERLGLGAVDGGRSHAAVREARVRDGVVAAGLGALHVEARRHNRNVVVAAARNLVALAVLELSGRGHAEAENQLVRCHGRLPVEALLEEVPDRDGALLARDLDQRDRRAARHEHRVEIRDGGSVGDVAADRASVADGSAGEPAQLLQHRRVRARRVCWLRRDLVLHDLLEAVERDGRAKVNRPVRGRDNVHFLHVRGAHEHLPVRSAELALDLELRVADDDLGVIELRLELEEPGEGGRTVPGADVSLKLKRSDGAVLGEELSGERKLGGLSIGRDLAVLDLLAASSSVGGFLVRFARSRAEGLERVKDGAVSGAAAQVAVDAVLDLCLRGGRVGAQQAVHAHHKSGCAEAAL
mmetsp:Transcript_42242/g.99144  ORF Transcript_42242/g.99144 Transcript_42242/m.99144 type:complete len:463 (+) Transcript_42242:2446-3834(+)